MAKMKKKPIIEYLELDESTYIEQDIVKSRLDENIDYKNFVTHDELWNRIINNMQKIREYDETHNQNPI